MVKICLESALKIQEQIGKLSEENSEVELKLANVKEDVKKDEQEEVKKIKEKFKGILAKTSKSLTKQKDTIQSKLIPLVNDKDVMIGQLYTKKAKEGLTPDETQALELLVNT